MGGTWEVLGRNMGGTFSCHLRYFFAFHSIPKRSSIEDKAKFYRRPIEHLSKIYRRPIEDLSKTYRRPIEHLSNTYRTSIEHLSKRACINCFIHLHMICLMRRRMGISPSIFFLTNDSSVRSLLRKSRASGMVL